MKIKFLKRWGCVNFGKIQPDFYEAATIVTLVDKNVSFDPLTEVDSSKASIALNGYAEVVKEEVIENVKVEYETKVIVPEIRIMEAETPKDKRNRKAREARAKKKKK